MEQEFNNLKTVIIRPTVEVMNLSKMNPDSSSGIYGTIFIGRKYRNVQEEIEKQITKIGN